MASAAIQSNHSGAMKDSTHHHSHKNHRNESSSNNSNGGGRNDGKSDRHNGMNPLMHSSSAPIGTSAAALKSAGRSYPTTSSNSNKSHHHHHHQSGGGGSGAGQTSSGNSNNRSNRPSLEIYRPPGTRGETNASSPSAISYSASATVSSSTSSLSTHHQSNASVSTNLYASVAAAAAAATINHHHHNHHNPATSGVLSTPISGLPPLPASMSSDSESTSSSDDDDCCPPPPSAHSLSTSVHHHSHHPTTHSQQTITVANMVAPPSVSGAALSLPAPSHQVATSVHGAGSITSTSMSPQQVLTVHPAFHPHPSFYHTGNATGTGSGAHPPPHPLALFAGNDAMFGPLHHAMGLHPGATLLPQGPPPGHPALGPATIFFMTPDNSLTSHARGGIPTNSGAHNGGTRTVQFDPALIAAANQRAERGGMVIGTTNQRLPGGGVKGGSANSYSPLTTSASSRHVPSAQSNNAQNNSSSNALKRSKSFTVAGAKEPTAHTPEATGFGFGDASSFVLSDQLVKRAVSDPNALSSLQLMEVVRSICTRATEGVCHAGPAAQICIAIIEKEHGEMFLESLINSVREWYNERDKLLRPPDLPEGQVARRWTAYVSFLSELYLRLKQRQKGSNSSAPSGDSVQPSPARLHARTQTLMMLLVECCSLLLKPPSLYNNAEVECLRCVLTLVGSYLEWDAPASRFRSLMTQLREAFVTPRLSPQSRKSLLEIVELRAAGWRFDLQQAMYYFPYTQQPIVTAVK